MTKKTTTSHHHGNLREALIEAGLELLESGGPQALTLRKCAALVGVSHAAPANHFNGLISLKVAIIARGHLIFADSMRQSSAKAESSPWAQLNAICEGYIRFAQTHQTLFQLMFQFYGGSLESVDEVSMTELQKASGESYGVLRQACTPFKHNENNAVNTETMIWSLVHGYAMLFSEKKSSEFSNLDIPNFSDILPALSLRDS